MKIVRFIFVCLFIVIIASPLVFLDRKSIVSETEKRTLAVIPRLNIKDIAAIPAHIDNYMNDRFGFRNDAITMMNYFNYYVLRKKHNSDVLVGKDDWLFYIRKDVGDSLSDFLKQNLMTDEQLKKFASNISSLDTFCKDNHITFLLLLAPEKHSVYPEKYPFLQPKGLTRTEQALNALPKQLREKVIYPRDYLISKKREHKEPLYYPNGTHWDILGAYYVYQLLYENLKVKFPRLPDIKFTFTVYEDTGEDSIWYLASGVKKDEAPITMLSVEPEDGWESHYSYIKQSSPRNTEEQNTRATIEPGRFSAITENRDKRLPKALVFRDSYFLTLEPFMSCIFSYGEYIWDENNKKNFNYILAQKPDIFIWELGERGLELLAAGVSF